MLRVLRASPGPFWVERNGSCIDLVASEFRLRDDHSHPFGVARLEFGLCDDAMRRKSKLEHDEIAVSTPHCAAVPTQENAAPPDKPKCKFACRSLASKLILN